MSEYCKNCYELAEQLQRYKQAIKEIENIVEKYKLSEKIIKLNRIDPTDMQNILNVVIKVKNSECEEVNKQEDKQ